MFNRKLKKRINELSLENFKLCEKLNKISLDYNNLCDTITEHSISINNIIEAKHNMIDEIKLHKELLDNQHKINKEHIILFEKNDILFELLGSVVFGDNEKKTIQQRKPRKQIKKK